MPAFMGGARPQPSHRAHNEQQWGQFLRPGQPEADQRRTARFLFDQVFLGGLGGIKSAMRDLGVTEETVAAWEASTRNILRIFEAHLEKYDFVLGGRVSTADYGLLGPLYAHLYKDLVPGKMMREEYPNVASWCERVHDHAGKPARGPEEWLPGDEVSDDVMQLLQVFFTEFWPVLTSTCEVLTTYLRDGHPGGPLPGKSFSPSCPAQSGHGRLTHSFSLPFGADGQAGGLSRGRRYVNPYHVWMLQRVEVAMQHSNAEVLKQFLSQFQGGPSLLELPAMIQHCRIRKEGGLLYAAPGDVGHRSRL